MANFNTHVVVAATASTVAAAMVLKAGLIEMLDAPWYILIGVIGGMLPDIDADNSTPVKRLFMFLAGLSSAWVWVAFQYELNPQRLMALVCSVFLAVRYPVFFIFQKMTVHRGVFHSLLGAFFFGLLTVCLTHYFLKWNVVPAWLSGLFLVFGFIVHLCLDELFSVDLANSRMKRSFGTALKLFSYKDIPASTLLLISVIALFIAAPSSSHLVEAWKRVDWAKAGCY